MRVEPIEPHLRCNQNCSFCTTRRPTDDPAFIAREAVERRIDDALGRAREVVFTGGEPTLRADLPALIARAKARGARAVLETNATLIDDACATALASAGLDLARVHVSGWGGGLDAITRDPGGFARSVSGIDALRRAGLEVEASAVLVRSTLPLLDALPAALAARQVRRLRLVVPVRAAAPDELLDYALAGVAVARLDRLSREVGLTVALDPSGPPPCVLPADERLAHLYSMTRGAAPREDHSHAPACARCVVHDRCSGLADAYVARFGLPTMRPIADERGRRRLAVVTSVEAQIARELVSESVVRHEGVTALDHVIRVNFHCNQACDFCFVSTHLPPAHDDAIRHAIESAARRGASITLSGGEPTLHPRLLEHVRHARAQSGRPITLQTNAVRLDDRGRVDALREAGVEQAFVSLHGSCPEVAELVTRAPGTFERTLRGVDNLLAAGVAVTTNFVICEANLHDLVATVRLVGTRWRGARFNVSFVAASTDVVPRDRALVPRYTDAMPKVAEALDAARALGLEVVGFESMCGVPLCLIPGEVERFVALAGLPTSAESAELVHTAACDPCALRARCFGLRRGYAELHGTTELRPVRVTAGTSS